MKVEAASYLTNDAAGGPRRTHTHTHRFLLDTHGHSTLSDWSRGKKERKNLTPTPDSTNKPRTRTRFSLPRERGLEVRSSVSLVYTIFTFASLNEFSSFALLTHTHTQSLCTRLHRTNSIYASTFATIFLFHFNVTLRLRTSLSFRFCIQHSRHALVKEISSTITFFSFAIPASRSRDALF